MMWYKSLIANFGASSLRFPTGRKKKPVKLTYPLILLPLHNHSWTMTPLGSWDYWVFADFTGQATVSVMRSQFYSLLKFHPCYLGKLRHLQARSFFNDYSLTLKTPFVPNLFTAWRNLSYSFLIFTSSKLFMKLRFRGKGYYLYRSKRNALSFRFGYAHRRYRYPGVVWYRMVSKTEIFLWNRSMFRLWQYAWTIKEIRPHNQYTGKGIRFLRQITYRKLGKIGSYR